MNDEPNEQTLMTGDKVIVTLGEGPPMEVKALCIEDSIKWTVDWGRKLSRLYPGISAIQSKLPELTTKDADGNTVDVEDKQAVLQQRVAVNEELADFMTSNHQLLLARDHLIAHGGIDADRCKKATARQIAEAFRAVYRMENPPDLNQNLL